MQRLTKTELIEIVDKISMGKGTEEEMNQWVDILENNVPHPEVIGLIFYPDKDMTSEEIVERALAYKPFILPSEMNSYE